MRSFGPGLVASLSALALLAGCAVEPDDDEAEATQLSALESSIGFDGAVERLDEAALSRVESEAATREARGDTPEAVERAASLRVLREAKSASVAPRFSELRLQSAYDSDLVKMNGQEKALCKGARLVCVRVLLAGFRARGAAQAQYRDGNVGGRIDAFRHTYWNALMVRAVGATHAKLWADAHENGYADNRATPANRVQSDMDFHNNAQGRQIGSVRSRSESDTRRAVVTALETGALRAVRYDNESDQVGRLVKSSECTDAAPCGR
jgi:hypothetical protein